MKAPIKGFNSLPYPQGHVTQYFGENLELYSRVVCVDDNGKKYCLAGHNGVDIVAPWGTPILSVENGVVIKVKTDAGGFGKYVKVRSESGDEWVYGHLSKIEVKLNQQLKEGEQLGLMGNTGFVISGDTPYWKHNPYAGTHLHLGVRRRMSGSVQNWRNGFYGYYDWMPRWNQTDDAKIPKQLVIISLANQVIDLLTKLINKKK